MLLFFVYLFAFGLTVVSIQQKLTKKNCDFKAYINSEMAAGTSHASVVAVKTVENCLKSLWIELDLSLFGIWLQVGKIWSLLASNYPKPEI